MARARSLLVVACALLAGCGSAAPPRAAEPAAKPAERWPDDARYALDLRYDERAYAISGTERISFANTGPAPLRAVWLRAWANAFGSCGDPRADVRVAAGGTLGERRQGCTALEIRLPEPLKPGARTEIALEVRVAVPSRPDRFGRVGAVASFGNGIPILAVADRGGWHLPPYTDRGESFYSLASSWTLRLRAKRGLAVASTGSQTASETAGDERTVTIGAPRARDFALVVGPMTVRTLDASGVRLRRFVKPGTPARDIRAALRTARAALFAYERRFGPYGAHELDIVEGPAEVANGGVAMEYPELVLSPAWPPALAHEIAHQWWFGIVGNDEWREPWLDEAMAEYATARLPRRIAGPNRLGECPGLPARRPALTSTMERFDKAPPRLYSRSIYVAGACALTRLERGLGRQQMDRFLRGLVSDHRYGVLTTAAFVRALRRAAPERFDVDRWLKRSRIDVR
jgi:hypothetical protein